MSSESGNWLGASAVVAMETSDAIRCVVPTTAGAIRSSGLPVCSGAVPAVGGRANERVFLQHWVQSRIESLSLNPHIPRMIHLDRMCFDPSGVQALFLGLLVQVQLDLVGEVG
jgi:hypothetical protein